MGTWLPVDSHALQSLGLAIVLTLWPTTLLALATWAFAKTRFGTAPSRRHTAAWAALLLAVVVAGGTWWGLAHPRPSALVAAANAQPALRQPAVPSHSADLEALANARLATGRLAHVFTRDWSVWVAMGWVLAVALLLLRLGCGVLTSVWIRHRATPLRSGPVADAVRRLSQLVGYRSAIDVVESPAIEYPAATGWRRPSLIVPCGMDISLAPEHLEPVIVHEIEHLRRGDQRLAVIQALVDTLLFFCPGARWLSGQAREAREHRCDDFAVRTCGSAPAYATALGVLAGRATGTWFSAVMGAQAPSLASRIRRVLNGETMKPLNRAQMLALLAATVTTIASGVVVLAASLEEARLSTSTMRSGAQAQDTLRPAALGVPTAFVPTQDGSPLTLTRVAGDDKYCFTRVTVRNISARRVSSATFLAVLEHRDGSLPAIVVRAEPAQFVLDPGETTDVAIAFLPIADVLEWKASRGVRAQAMLGLLEVGFAAGNKWAITPPADATSENEVFYIPGPEVSRALLWTPDQPRRPGEVCHDDRGRPYSPGALVPIRGEKGHVASCVDGVWEEQKPKGEL